ncbi:MAG: ferric reductase-like transmembrane domain-containing protein [Coriobacteriia bacterium]|nr:ferric reductase-like transmembrane domain-containing protein [Coriobacteriia bacterium]
MRFLAGLVIAVLFTAILHVPLRKAPWVFYVLALLLDVLLIAGNYVSFPPWFREYFLFLFQSNTLAMGFFTIVMFTGVMSNHSALKKTLLSIRAEISIIASILCIGHIVKYGESYFGKALSSISSMPSLRLAATLIALILVLMLIPLAITSIKLVRKRMKPKSWSNLQRLAYPFYGLIFIHIYFFLLQPARAGSQDAVIALTIYSIFGLAYLLLRIGRYLHSQKALPVLAKTVDSK